VSLITSHWGVTMQYIADSWQRFAACKGPHADLFYPPNTVERREERARREADAKSICAECPVIEECLEHALSIGETYGIWGGKSEVERRVLLDQRNKRMRKLD